MNKAMGTLAAAALLLCSCQGTPTPPPPSTPGLPFPNQPAPNPAEHTPYALTATERAAVEKGVRNSLKDPMSAMFGEMKASRDPKSKLIQVCGYVNAKNSFGGYTGNALFFGGLADTHDGGKAFIPIGSISTGDIDTQVTQAMCGKASIYL